MLSAQATGASGTRGRVGEVRRSQLHVTSSTVIVCSRRVVAGLR